ncbi:MAG: pyridoxal-phosphate dependent enzyme, partial [Halieaceae bacterium]|nr:pyridoxal-phosphate dependent enzyme [Halieaceae bacterium]
MTEVVDPVEALARQLARHPREPLADSPTPLRAAPRLSEDLGQEVWVKRDDLTGFGLGGNKVRKLEFLLGRARADGCDTIVTFGALQSNHARQTAAACAAGGLRCELILTRAVPRSGEAFEHGGNLALDHLFGATVTVVDDDDDAIAAAMGTLHERIDARGGVARWVPPGGSDAV